MALAKEFMGFSSKEFMLNNSFQQKQGMFWVNPILLPLENTRVIRRLRKGARFPVAAISEDVIKTTLTVHAEKPVQFKVRAVVTVRNKIKQDFKETMLKHLDAINDRIGTRNIVLELISTQIDPSKPAFHVVAKHNHSKRENSFFFPFFFFCQILFFFLHFNCYMAGDH